MCFAGWEWGSERESGRENENENENENESESESESVNESPLPYFMLFRLVRGTRCWILDARSRTPARLRRSGGQYLVNYSVFALCSFRFT